MIRELAITVLWGVLVTFVYISAHQHQRQPLLIDAALETNAAPDQVCIHVLTPDVIRRRSREVTNT